MLFIGLTSSEVKIRCILMISELLLTNNCIIDLKASPHILVSGVTGSTKTNTVLTAMLSAMSSKSRLADVEEGMSAKTYLIDGKGGDLATLSMLHPAVTPNQAAKTLRIIVKNMKQRYQHFSGNFGLTAADYEENGKSVRPVILVIDELAVLLNDPSTRAEIQRTLFELLIAARQASIYVSPRLGHK